MTWNECREWAEEQMQKTFDGKRWKFSNTARGIAEKAYLEGVNEGYAVAQHIINASPCKLSEIFSDIDLDGYTEPEIVVLNIYTGREAMRAFEKYDAEQEDPINKKKEDIIRCGECKFYTGTYCHHKMQYGLGVTESDYCSKGERKDG